MMGTTSSSFLLPTTPSRDQIRITHEFTTTFEMAGRCDGCGHLYAEGFSARAYSDNGGISPLRRNQMAALLILLAVIVGPLGIILWVATGGYGYGP
jgi:hypothetical protein